MEPNGLTDATLPGVWRKADAVSQGGQTLAIRLEVLRLMGTLFAAFGSVLSLQIGRLDAAAGIILLGFAAALIAELTKWIRQPEKDWHDGRALAESAKTLAWRYAVGAAPFPMTLSDGDARGRLQERFESIMREGLRGSHPLPLDSFVTAEMQSLRGASFDERRDAYVSGRTRDQYLWYAQKAESNRVASTRWRVFLVSVEVLAVSLAALRVFGGWDMDLAGAAAALIAAGGAWAATKQYTPLATSYALAATELRVQIDRIREASEEDWAAVAGAAEEAISREHTMWLATRANMGT